MLRIWKPFFSNCSMMSPTAFLRTASGLMIVRVRSRVFIIFRILVNLEILPLPNLADYLHSYTHRSQCCFADYGWRPGYPNSSRFHGLNFLFRGSFAAGDDRAGMPHAASRRSGLSSDETDHRLLHVIFYIL